MKSEPLEHALPLDDLPPLHRELARELGLVCQGRLIALELCPCCVQLLRTPCVRCGMPACGTCDLCHGCGQIICERCNDPRTPRFSYPGDVHAHPHNI